MNKEVKERIEKFASFDIVEAILLAAFESDYIGKNQLRMTVLYNDSLYYETLIGKYFKPEDLLKLKTAVAESAIDKIGETPILIQAMSSENFNIVMLNREQRLAGRLLASSEVVFDRFSELERCKNDIPAISSCEPFGNTIPLEDMNINTSAIKIMSKRPYFKSKAK